LGCGVTETVLLWTLHTEAGPRSEGVLLTRLVKVATATVECRDTGGVEWGTCRHAAVVLAQQWMAAWLVYSVTGVVDVVFTPTLTENSTAERAGPSYTADTAEERVVEGVEGLADVSLAFVASLCRGLVVCLSCRDGERGGQEEAGGEEEGGGGHGGETERVPNTTQPVVHV